MYKYAYANASKSQNNQDQNATDYAQLLVLRISAKQMPLLRGIELEEIQDVQDAYRTKYT